MNKKRLSVVMAGAMLASSVSPVLAEEVAVTEVQKGTLINDLTNKLWDAPRFSNVKDTRVDKDLKGASVYALVVDGGKLSDTEEKAVITATIKANNTKADLQEKVKTLVEKAETAGKTVNLVNLGSRTDKDKDGNDLILSTEVTTTYTEAELSNTDSTLHTTVNALGNTNIVTKGEYVSGKGYVITLASDIDMNGDTKNETEIVLTTKSPRLDFTKYYDKQDNYETKKFETSTLAANFGGFAEAPAQNDDIADKVEAKYKVSADGTNFKLSDLFDGVMLTEKGQSLLDAAKATNSVLVTKGVADASSKLEKIVKIDGEDAIATAFANKTPNSDGVFKIKLEIADANKVAESVEKSSNGKTWNPANSDYRTYYVTAESKAELKKIIGWIDALSANVDVLAGEDRYATAVKIAKEVASLENLTANSGKYNIVLVNGDSLVDGLAAAPLAEHLKGTGNAPILLTEKNGLPRATKRYLNDLIDSVGNSNVTVSIVGGTGVVSKSVERELKDLNLKIERFGGEDREATSMAVAEEIGFDKGAYVVGATGEADAMSIAGYAAENKTPIIVSGFEGLSEDTLEALEGKRVIVIGGDSAVSASEYTAIKDVALTLDRVSGSDRKATNAAVINRFYGGNFSTGSVIVAKDDVLIDALTSANLSAKQHSPIVLGTNSLSEAQVDAIAANAAKAQKVYQVGYGVDAQNVVKVVAQSLGLI